MHIGAHKELRIWLERLNNLLLNTVKPKFGAIFVFLGTTSSFIEIISSSETEAKREAILFLFGCSEVNSTLLITSELTNHNARKALFTCVVYANNLYLFMAFSLIRRKKIQPIGQCGLKSSFHYDVGSCLV